MTLDFLPPLLRGIGTTVILIAALISFAVARQSTELQRKEREQKMAAISIPAASELARLTEEVEEIRLEAEEDPLVEKVFENRWFEWMGFVGTAVIAGSFYLESFLKTPKRKTDDVADAESNLALEESMK